MPPVRACLKTATHFAAASPAMRPAGAPRRCQCTRRHQKRCFETDRPSRRNFSYLMRKGHDIFLVAEVGGTVAGYAIFLLHGTSSLARLSSMAVDPDYQRCGSGRVLQSHQNRRGGKQTAIPSRRQTQGPS